MRPTTDAERIQLLHDAADAALNALRDELHTVRPPSPYEGYLGGDHIDYANAALDQLRFCAELLNGNRPLDDLDRLLDYTTDTVNELMQTDDDAAGFVYGYADHRSPISDLMIANEEND